MKKKKRRKKEGREFFTKVLGIKGMTKDTTNKP